MPQAPAETGHDTAAFDALDRTLRASGPGAALDQLIGHLAERGEFRALLDALLLKARHELGLPLVQVGPLAEIPEPARSRYEDRYVEAIRSVGGKLLDAGDVPSAWPYFRAIGEPEPVARAVDAYEPAEGDERLGAMIEVAFNQGANPRKGFALILDHYGTCSAISAFEHLPADEATRAACADRLVRQVHAHLAANLRADITARGEPAPPEGASIPDLIAGRDGLFDDDAYHLDVSHLAATVRLSPLLTDPATIALAVELTDYGRRLSERHRYEGEPPFERTYEDHAVYLRALLGRDVDAAVSHFRAKLTPPDPELPDGVFAAQVLVGLLLRVGRLEEAIGVAAEHLGGIPESALGCPSVAQLCQRAGQPGRLARIAREHGDLVNYAAAMLQAGSGTARA
jgi:hypothetical protein